MALQVGSVFWPLYGTRSSTIFEGKVDMIGVLSPRAYALNVMITYLISFRRTPSEGKKSKGRRPPDASSRTVDSVVVIRMRRFLLMTVENVCKMAAFLDSRVTSRLSPED